MPILDGTVVICEDQQKGRGQRENGWQSRKGQSLTFSIFKRFESLVAQNQFAISMATSIGIASVLDDLEIPKISVKWPNDILSGNKKIAGILIENVLEGSQIKYAVIGIGINVNEKLFPKLPQASSLQLEMGKTFDLEEIFQAILKGVFTELDKLTSHDFSKLKQQYETWLFRKEMESIFEFPDGNRFNGRIRGISDYGELVVETNPGSLQEFSLKEVRLVY